MRPSVQPRIAHTLASSAKRVDSGARGTADRATVLDARGVMECVGNVADIADVSAFASASPTPRVEADVAELLDLIDARSQGGSIPRHEARANQRRRLRVECVIRYFARDGATVLTAGGKTRDISRTGLGLISNRPIPSHSLVHVHVKVPDSKPFNLTGEVTHTRNVRGDWYLIGVQFRKAVDGRLNPPPDQSS